MIERLKRSPHISLSLIILNDTAPPAQNKTLFRKLWNNRYRLPELAIRWLLEQIYTKLIDRHPRLPDSDQPADLTELLHDIPVLRVSPIRGKWTDSFSPADIELIQEHRLDILVRSGFGILRGPILRAARYGIWSLHHGDHLINRGGPAGFWESMEDWPETGTVLQVLTEELDGGTILFKSFAATDAMSVRDNRSNMFWKAVSFIPRKVEELAIKGEDAFFQDVDKANQHPSFYCKHIYKRPTVSQLTFLTAKKVLQKTGVLLRNALYFDQWCLLLDMRDELSAAMWRYKRIVPPKDRFWADPHIIQRGNKYYAFIEEYIYTKKRGHIAVIEIDENGIHSQPVTVLELDYHLSYPFVFEHDGAIYMVPETMENRTIDLYKCVEFPYKWKWQMTLIDNICAVDATLLLHCGRWWIFANVVENEGASSCDELFLFSADELFSGKWTPHPMNPVVSDCKSARPAGRLFGNRGTLYRPSQDCSVRYGHGFNLCAIDVLNETQYGETVVAKVHPKWRGDIIGTHTFSRVGRLNMSDALVRRWR